MSVTETPNPRSDHRTEQEVETSVLDGINGQVGKTLDWILGY